MDEQALLRAILADPGDDTVRLAYADWLDEHDQADRAEFIRVQIELAHLSPEDSRLLALYNRGSELFWGVLRKGRLRQEAPAELAPYVAQQYSHYRRGFLTRVELYATVEKVTEFLPAASALFTHAPVEELSLRPTPGMDWYGRQDFADPVSAEAVGVLAGVPELSRLSVVELGSPVDDINAACRALVANLHLRNLRRLHISNRWPPAFDGLPPKEDWYEEELAPDTQRELRDCFGDRVVWDA